MREDVKQLAIALNADINKANRKYQDCVKNSGIFDKHSINEFTTGNRKYGSLYYLSLIASSTFIPKTVLEIGTYKGRATLAMNYYLPNTKITTIDISTHAGLRTKVKNNEIDNIEMILMDSNELKNKFAESKFDLIFVDGDHMDPTVSADIEYAYNHLSERGVILFDDYGHGGVTNAVDSLQLKSNEVLGIVPWSLRDEWHKIAYLIRGNK